MNTGAENVAPHLNTTATPHDKYEIKITDLVMNSEKGEDSEATHKDVGPRNRTFNNFVTNRDKISLADLKDNEVLGKIRDRCTLLNPKQ